MKPIRNFGQLVTTAQELGPRTAVIAGARDREALLAAAESVQRRIADCILVGDAAAIKEAAAAAGVALGAMIVVDVADPERVALEAMCIAGRGQADMVVKGHVPSDAFLRAALSREANLRRRLLTHVGPYQIPGVDRLIFISDGGVVLYPTAPQKVEIIQNAIRVARLLGIEVPKVALVAASDRVNPAVPSTMEATALVVMARQGQVVGGLVDGPMPLDVAMSAEAAAAMDIDSPVAAHADVLIAHDVEAGNIMGKGITYFAGGRMAGIVVGAKVPLVLGSRADDRATRLACLALGVVLAARGYKEIWG